MRRPAVALLTGILLTGCSNSPEDVRADYCEDVEDHQVALSDALAEDSPDALLGALPIFQDLADAAPRDIEDDWAVFLDALEGLDEALDEAGVEAAAYDADQPPADVTEDQQAAIARAADQLARPEVSQAYEGVKQQAKDVCKTALYQ